MSNEFKDPSQVSFLLLLNFWITCLLFVWKIVPFFERVFRSEFYNFIYLACIALWFFTSICIYSNWILKMRASLLAGIMWMLYFYLICIPYYTQVEIGFINLNTTFIFPLFVFEFYNSIKAQQLQSKITMVCMIFFLAGAILGLTTLSENEMAARMTGTGSYEDDLLNAGSYTFTHALIVLIPGLLFCCHSLIRSRLKKIVIVALSMISIYYILSCGYMISIISGIFAAMLYLFLKGCTSVNQVLIRIFLLSAVFLLFIMMPLTEYFIEVLLSIRDYTSDVVSTKIDEMVFALMYGSTTGDWAYRNELTLRSIATFFENILWGIGPGSTGYYYQMGMLSGHAQIPDDLARYGVIGSIIWINVYIQYCRVLINGYRDTPYFTSILSSLVIFVFIGLLNPTLYSTIGIALFFIVPSIPTLVVCASKNMQP